MNRPLGWLVYLLVAVGAAARPVAAAPLIQHWQTANGMRVYFVEAPELPMIDVRLAFDAGSARDGGHPGIGRMTTSLLDEGAGEWDADAIASRFEAVGAQYSAAVDRDMAWLSLRTLSQPEYRDKALETFVAVAGAPRFDQRAFERIRNITLVALRKQEQEPGDVADKAFYRALYGDHPYAHPVIGTPESVNALSPQLIKGHYRSYFVARNGILAIVGALARPQAEALAEQLSRPLAQGSAAPPLPSPRPVAAARTIRTPFPSEQAHVYLGQLGVRRGDPDYFPLYVGNHILGGNGLNSLLVKEVRIKRGLSYSVYSYFIPLAVEGPFELNLQTRADQADKAIEVARDTLAAYVAKGPTEAQLEAAQKNLTGGFPLRIDSNANIVSYLVVIGFYGLPLDYLDTFKDKVSAVTTTGIREAFQRRLNVDRMVTVIVGSGRGDQDLEHD